MLKSRPIGSILVHSRAPSRISRHCALIYLTIQVTSTFALIIQNKLEKSVTDQLGGEGWQQEEGRNGWRERIGLAVGMLSIIKKQSSRAKKSTYLGTLLLLPSSITIPFLMKNISETNGLTFSQ